MNKIVVAADSFKGCLSSIEVANAIEKGIKRVLPICSVSKFQIADGGEGTVDALVASTNGEFVEAEVMNPLMLPIKAKYGIINGDTAVVEMATASGLPLIKIEERNPLKTTTFGTGELIKDALARGCRSFIIGIGGSATNDAGLGMLQALGYRFYDAKGSELGVGGEIMNKVASVDDSNVVKGLREATFRVACDVTNPFCGKEGAAYIYAPQKGADEKMVEELDNGMDSLRQLFEKLYSIDLNCVAGTGAAGGLGGAFHLFLKAELLSGIKLVLDAIDFDNAISDADMVITGEGKIDAQSMMGKTIQGILSKTKKANVPLVAIAGAVEGVEEINKAGVKAAFSITPAPMTLEKAMDSQNTERNIENTISQIISIAVTNK